MTMTNTQNVDEFGDPLPNSSNDDQGFDGAVDTTAPDQKTPGVVVNDAHPLGVQVNEAVPFSEAVRDEAPGGLSFNGIALETKKLLAKEPKVRMTIPFDPGETKGARRNVTINGYRFSIAKNVMVDLPESVANLLQKAYNTENAVASDHPLNLQNQSDATKRAVS